VLVHVEHASGVPEQVLCVVAAAQPWHSTPPQSDTGQRVQST
jgi:hypothetical protein